MLDNFEFKKCTSAADLLTKVALELDPASYDPYVDRRSGLSEADFK